MYAIYAPSTYILRSVIYTIIHIRYKYHIIIYSFSPLCVCICHICRYACGHELERGVQFVRRYRVVEIDPVLGAQRGLKRLGLKNLRSGGDVCMDRGCSMNILEVNSPHKGGKEC